MSSVDVARWAIAQAKEQGIKLETARQQTRTDARKEAGRAVKQAKVQKHFVYELDIARLEKEGRIVPGTTKGIGLPGVAMTQKWLGSGSPRDFRLGVATMIVQMVALNFAMKDLAGNDQFNQVETRFKATLAVVSLAATIVETVAISVEKSVEHPLGAFIRKQWAASYGRAAKIVFHARGTGLIAGLFAAGWDLVVNAPKAFKEENYGLTLLYILSGALGVRISFAVFFPLSWPILLLSIAIGVAVSVANTSALKTWISRCEFSKGEKYTSFEEQVNGHYDAVGG